MHTKRQGTIHGEDSGPILLVSPDGEAERTPEQLESNAPSGRQRDSSVQPSEDQHADAQGSDNDTVSGTWTSATYRRDGPRRPDPKTAFSSFRGTDSNDKKGKGNGANKKGKQRTKSGSGEVEDGALIGRAKPNSPEAHKTAQKHWDLLRDRALPGRSGTGPAPGTVGALSKTAVNNIPITTEMLSAQLPVMMLKTWLDRDEDGNRAVPVLLHNLRFVIGESVGVRQGQQTGKEMFKISCEYGDGVVKWVSTLWGLA
jgi:phospholipase D1/2